MRILPNLILVLWMLNMACLTCTLWAQDGAAANWPNFRGPTLNGTSNTATPPTSWSETKNIKWKVEIPGSGNNSSPVVWDDKIFVLTAIPEKKSNAAQPQQNQAGRRRPAAVSKTKFVTICYDRASGQVVWQKTAVDMLPATGTHPDHSFASASPITDGSFVYSHFGSRGLFCYDMDGNLQWKRDDLGTMRTRLNFGEGSSPTLHGDTMVIPWDHEGQSFLMAIDKHSGETKWKKNRDEPSNWVTPRVVVADGKTQVVTGGEKFARGYDIKTGKELWRVSGFTARPISTPVVSEDLAYVASGRQGFRLSALRLNGNGLLNETDSIVWSTQESAPDVPSLMLSEGRLYFMTGSSNIFNCLDAISGKRYQQKRLNDIRGVYASPVAADGKVIVVGRSGTSVVLDDSDIFDVIAINKLDDRIDATPALVGSEIILRGKQHLYCIAEK